MSRRIVLVLPFVLAVLLAACRSGKRAELESAGTLSAQQSSIATSVPNGLSSAPPQAPVEHQHGDGADAAACPLPSGTVCTDFNANAGMEMVPMQQLYGNQWDVRVGIRDYHAIPTPITMDTGCPVGNYVTVSDPNMMAAVMCSHMMSVMNDDGAGFITMRGRSPFDFTGRTGSTIFTVDWRFTARQWVELWILDPSQQMRYPGDDWMPERDHPTNAIRLAFQEVLHATLTRGGTTSSLGDAAAPASANNVRNKITVKLSTTHLTVITDGATTFDTAINPPLSFSKGNLIFMHDFYNPLKDCIPGDPVHGMDCAYDTAHWDNMGYDGAATPYAAVGTPQDVVVWADSTPKGVTLNHPTGGTGKLWFSAYGVGDQNRQYRLNGGAWQTLPVGMPCYWRTYAFPATFAKGANTVEFRTTGAAGFDSCVGSGQFNIHRIDLEVPGSP